MTYSGDVLALSPLAYYRLNETSSLVDSSGNARHGTFVGTAPSVVTGLVVGDSDQALLWASSGRGEVTDAAWMDATSFSIVGTIKPTAVAAASSEIICRYNGTASGTWAANSFAFRLNTNKIQGGIFTGGTTFGSATGTTVLVVNNTYDVAMTYDGTNGAIRVYLNGALEASATRTGMNNASTPITIGATQAATEPFPGTIDDLSFHTGVLTAEQIGQLSWVRRGSTAITVRTQAMTTEVLGPTPAPTARVQAVNTEVLADTPAPPVQVQAVNVEAQGSVYAPPDPPTDLVYTPNSFGMELSWTAPTGGSPVTEYEVRMDGAGWDSTTDSSYNFLITQWPQVSGLPYDLQVRSFGPGGPSAWVTLSDRRAPFVYRQIYTADSSFTVPDHVYGLDILVVGGGGGGGRSQQGGGGGAAGGVRREYAWPVLPGEIYSVTIGAGGAGGSTNGADGGDGANSVFGSLTATGGGGGAGSAAGRPGGSGGGGHGGNPGSMGGAGTPGQGYAGGQGISNATVSFRGAGGGGGADGVGESVPGNTKIGGNGGSAIDLTAWYGTSIGVAGLLAGGGGGGICASTGTGIRGGNAGGGGSTAGRTAAQQVAAANATANTGSGAGGSGGDNTSGLTMFNGGTGGSGLVVVTWCRTGVTYDADTSFVVPTGVTEVDVMVVGGGAGGGSGVPSIGTAVGGGGAGGYGWWEDHAVTPGDTVTVTVGAGGAVGAAGGSSSFGALTRSGGGAGGASGGVGNPGASGGGGGSGGGSGVTRAGGAGIPGEGNNGGLGIGAATSPGRRGGGGGGAGEAGHAATETNPPRNRGGFGIDSSLRVGLNLRSADGWFAGGGAGGDQEGSNASPLGGRGGGGQGHADDPATPGTPGTGGGGGGGADGASFEGGRGVVAVLYEFPEITGWPLYELSTSNEMKVWTGDTWSTVTALQV